MATPEKGSGSTEKHAETRQKAAKWLSERRRIFASAIFAVIVGLVVVIPLSVLPPNMALLDASVLVLLAYVTCYLVITSIAFSRATPEQIRTWATRDHRGTFIQRYVSGAAPGPGVSLFFSVIALAIAMVWMPGYGGTTLPPHVRVAIAAALIAAAWVSVVVSYAVTFHADNILERGKGLDFPGTPNPQWSDYVYFAMAVMTTFGTTDVSVTSREMRMTVTVNAVLAFVFNTVTVAAVVSALMG